MHHFRKITYLSFWYSIFFFILFLVGIAFYLLWKQNSYQTKVFPGVSLAGQSISDFSYPELDLLLKAKDNVLANTAITLMLENQALATIEAKTLDLRLDHNQIVSRIKKIGKNQTLLSTLMELADIFLFNAQTNLEIVPSYNLTTFDSELSKLAEQFYQAPIDAKFTITDAKVSEFTPHTNGQTLDINTAKTQLQSLLPTLLSPLQNTTQITLNLSKIPLAPKNTLASLNSLGIAQEIGVGHSNYSHSSAERAYNVSHASKILNGTIIPQGSTFSFNSALGDISKATGYKQAYVISAGRTQLGDGGGVCQTSSTFFRAALSAGLPIAERKAHAYRVRYYENDSDPGFDATVYAPSPDLKVVNDTPGAILLWIEDDPQKMTLKYSLWGTKDDRVASVSNYKKWGQSGPPASVYQDDPTLARGVTKQVDFAVGGINTSFDYTVTKANNVHFQKTFVSNFRPWAAVYLVGTRD